jgi:hypothetical protein
MAGSGWFGVGGPGFGVGARGMGTGIMCFGAGIGFNVGNCSFDGITSHVSQILKMVLFAVSKASG